MGDSPEMILDGTLDSIRGEYIRSRSDYPRSFFDATKYTGDGPVSMSTKKIKKYFKDLFIQELQPGAGLNIKLPGNGTVTVWWRKGKWTHSKNPNKWFYFRNAPKEHANELIAQIEGLMGVVIKPRPIEDTTGPSGIQQCIDHLLSKAEKIGSLKGADNATAAMLKIVANELKQYL